MHPTFYAILPSKDSTLAAEIYKTGLMRRRKHLLFFEEFRGELSYVPDFPENSVLTMTIDAGSVVCRDNWLRPKRQAEISRYARSKVLDIEQHPRISFTSHTVVRKPLRGFAVGGTLSIRETTRPVSVNVVVNQTKPEILQIDGDTTFRLSDFGIDRPSSLLGLIGTKDEVLIRLLLWATRLN